jgi:predicted metalloprotease with PDZ domain
MQLLRTTVLSTILAGLSAISCAEIVYTVSSPSEGSLKVKLDFSAAAGLNQLQIPNWAPGSYSYADNYKRVTNFVVTGASDSGSYDSVSRTWSFSAVNNAKVSVSYEVPVQYAAETGHFSGPSTFVYLVGRKLETCRLKFDFAAATPIAVGLDPVVENKEYVSPNYDVLCDNPVTFGAFTMDKYVLQGKPHFIAYRGAAKSDIDFTKVREGCLKVTKMQTDFFGGKLPYNRYVWHFAVTDSTDGAGGLEHLSSTQISLASGFGPRAFSVCSHEFFHLWNVKRIRSKPLGPFDYTTLPQTGALWWLEGVTDYYAHTLLARYDLWPKSMLYDDLLSNYRGVQARPERLKVSPYESSYRVRDAANGRGNSQGFGVSYYNTGWLCGLLLDVEIMDKSNGKYSLDNVEHALWDLCREDKPGFEEDEIRKQCVRFGGASLGEFYDRVIMTPGDLPVQETLAKLGLQMVDINEKYTKLGFTGRPDLVSKSYKVSASNIAGLSVGDVITTVNGKSLELGSNRAIAQAWSSVVDNLKPFESLTISKRDSTGIVITQTIVTTTGYRMVKKIAELPSATEKQKKIRKLLESKKR